MEQNPKRTKALIITFIVALGLLMGVYYLFFSGNAPFSTKSGGTAKSFFPFLGTSKNKDLNTIQNGESGPVLTGGETTTDTSGTGMLAGGQSNGTSGGTSTNDQITGGDTTTTDGTSTGQGTNTGGITTPLTQCADGIDNDGNGVLDADDASCHTDNNIADTYTPEKTLEFTIPTKNFPIPTSTFIPQCSDKKDNDGDGKIDTQDPGCHTDNDIAKPYDKNRVTEFSLDSTKGKIDACVVSSGTIPSTGGTIPVPTGPIVIPQCSDGIDNNNDGPFDIQDPGCHSDLNPNNGLSYNPQKVLEMITAPSIPQCSDGLDNDGNGLRDAQDPTCFIVPADPKSYNPMLSPEGKGFSNGVPVPVPATTTGTTTTTGSGTTTTGGVFGPATTTTGGTGTSGTTNGGSTAGSTVGGGAVGGTVGGGAGGAIITQCSDGLDNDLDGKADALDPGCHSDKNPQNNGQNGTPNTYDPKINLEIIAKKEQKSLFAGLWQSLKENTAGNKVLSKIVLAVNTPTATLQVAGSPAGTLTGVPTLATPLSTTTGSTVITSTAVNSGVPIQTLSGIQTLPLTMFGIYPGQQLPLTPDQLSAYLDSLGANKQVVDSNGIICPDTKNNPVITQCSDGKDNDGDKKIDAQDPGCHFDLNARNTKSYTPTKNDEKEVLPQCSDKLDNDKDGKFDSADPDCHYDFNPLNPGSFLKTKNSEASITNGNGSGNGGALGYIPQCRDGLDNDGDGLSDKLDPGCHLDLNAKNASSYIGDKTSELDFIPACIDGKDNDGDGLSDANDPGCHWDLNAARVELCSDGKDNDGDKLADKNDPACHTDGNASNILSYDKDLGVDTYTPYKYSEFNLVPQCRDFDANGKARDNDGDGLANDLDPGCHTDLNASHNGKKGAINTYDPEKTLELNYVPQCSDGKDNDKDGLLDDKDPGCYINKNVAVAKDYNPEDSNEMEFDWNGNKGTATKTTAPNCPDTNITLKFTKEEQDELNQLIKEFYALSPNLKNSVDVASEQDKKIQYDKLTAVSNALTEQCVQDKAIASYKGPKETMRNPYFTTDPNYYYLSQDASYDMKDASFVSQIAANFYRFTKKVYDVNDTDQTDKVVGTDTDYWNHQRAFSYHPDEPSGVDNSPGWLGKWDEKIKIYETSYPGSVYPALAKKNHYLAANVGYALDKVLGLRDTNEDCLDASTGYFAKNDKDVCYNRPAYGLYDIKNIVDKAWREGRKLKDSEILRATAAPNWNQIIKGDYEIRSIQETLDIYINPPYGDVKGKYFCNFGSDTTKDILANISPDNHSQIVCPLFKSLRGNLDLLKTTDIHELKRTIDDYALRLKSGDPALFYWKNAMPDQSFEAQFQIW